VLAGLFLASTVSAVRAALASAGVIAPERDDAGHRHGGSGPVVVVGDAKLAKALRAEGVATVVVAPKPPRGVPDALTGSVDKLPLEAGTAAACVGVGASARPGAVAEWCRVVRDGGAVVIVDRRPPVDTTRVALCAGLTELEQRAAGRVTVTSGLVTSLA
jgi:hypothetical protein